MTGASTFLARGLRSASWPSKARAALSKLAEARYSPDKATVWDLLSKRLSKALPSSKKACVIASLA